MTALDDTSTSSDFEFRFGGIRRLYGAQALQVFEQAHLCVVGIGGVGSWAAEALARSGVGRITLIDLDDVCVSNVNRQIHALNGEVGRLKVEVMADRIRRINPDCRVEPVAQFVTPANMASLIHCGMDVVVDAIDSIKAKTQLIAHCKRQKIPVVVAGGAGGQTDPTLIQVADLGKTFQDPLLARVRTKLKKEHGLGTGSRGKFGIECVFSAEQLKYPQPDGSVCQQKPAGNGPVRLDCASGFGAVTMVTGTFGFFLAARALSKLMKASERETS